jgi:hypothetical protein
MMPSVCAFCDPIAIESAIDVNVCHVLPQSSEYQIRYVPSATRATPGDASTASTPE